VTETMPDDVGFFRFDRDIPSPIETHATYRIEAPASPSPHRTS
jgi:hypothetical protein